MCDRWDGSHTETKLKTEKDISSVLRQIQLGNATLGSSAAIRRPGQPLFSSFIGK